MAPRSSVAVADAASILVDLSTEDARRALAQATADRIQARNFAIRSARSCLVDLGRYQAAEMIARDLQRLPFRSATGGALPSDPYRAALCLVLRWNDGRPLGARQLYNLMTG